MPRHTRTHKQRRLDAYKQRQREHDLTQLGRELRFLWWQYEAWNGLTGDADGDLDGARGYVDPKLAFWSPDAR